MLKAYIEMHFLSLFHEGIIIVMDDELLASQGRGYQNITNVLGNIIEAIDILLVKR
jgi:hypothetical protein